MSRKTLSLLLVLCLTVGLITGFTGFSASAAPGDDLSISAIEDQTVRIVYAKPGAANAVDWGVEPLVVTLYTSEPGCTMSFSDSAGILAGSFSQASHDLLDCHEVLTLVANGSVGTTTVTVTAEKAGEVGVMSFDVFVTEFYDTGEYDWGELKIHGAGAVTGYIFHPTTPNILYACTDVGGVWRFNFETKSWEDITKWITPALASVGQSRAVGVDATPGRENWVYLSYGNGSLLRSTDRGDSWYTVGSCGISMGGNSGNSRGLGGNNLVSVPQPKPQNQWVTSPEYDDPLKNPANYNAPMIYALSNGGIRRNTTMTETADGAWTNIASLFGNSGAYSAMVYANDNPNLQFVGSGAQNGTNLAWYSSNNGTSFTQLPGQPARRSTTNNCYYFPTKAAFTAPFTAETLPAFDSNAAVGDRYLLVTYNDPGDSSYGVTDGFGQDGCVYRWLIAADGTVKGNGANITPLAVDGTYVRWRAGSLGAGVTQNRMIGVGMCGLSIDPNIPGAMICSTIISYNYVRDKRYAHYGYDTIFRSLDYGESWFPVLCGFDLYGNIEKMGEGVNGEGSYYAAPAVNGDFFTNNQWDNILAAKESGASTYQQVATQYAWGPWTPVHWMFTPTIDPFNSDFLLFNTGVGPYCTYNLTALDHLAADYAEPNAKTQYGLTDAQAVNGFYQTTVPTGSADGNLQNISSSRKTSAYTAFKLRNSINNLTNDQSVAWYTSPGLYMTVQKISSMYSPPSGRNIALTNTWDYTGWAFEGLDHVPWNGWSFAQWIPEKWAYLFKTDQYDWEAITAATDPKYLPPKPATNIWSASDNVASDVLSDIYAPTNRGISGDNTDYVDANPDYIVSTARTDYHFDALGGAVISFDGGRIFHNVPDGHGLTNPWYYFGDRHPSMALMGSGGGMPTTALQNTVNNMKASSNVMIGNVAIGADAKTLVWGLSSVTASIANHVVSKASEPLLLGQTWFQPEFYNTAGARVTTGNVRVFSDRVDPDVFYAFGATTYVSIDGARTFRQAAFTALDGNAMPAVSSDGRHVKGEVGNAYNLWVDGNGLYKVVYNKETNSFTTRRVVGTTASATTFGASSRSGIGLGSDGTNAVQNGAIYVHGSYTAQNGNGNSGVGIYRSLDGGATWTKISPTVAAHPQPAGTRTDPYLNANFPFADVRSVVGDPRTFGRVYLSQGNVAGGSRYGDMIVEPVKYKVDLVVAGMPQCNISEEVVSGMKLSEYTQIAGVDILGLYTDEAMTIPYDYAPVSGDMTLYAAPIYLKPAASQAPSFVIRKNMIVQIKLDTNAESLSYTSSNSVIATVTQAGVVTGKSIGVAVIQVKDHNTGLVFNFVVNVTN